MISDGWADERSPRAWQEQQLLVIALLRRCGGKATIPCSELDPNWVRRRVQILADPVDYMMDQVTLKLVEEE